MNTRALPLSLLLLGASALLPSVAGAQMTPMPVLISKDKAAGLPRNDPGAGICATVSHAADPLMGVPFKELDQIPPTVNVVKGTVVAGLTIDEKVSKTFKDIHFHNGQPGTTGDFAGAGAEQSYFPFSMAGQASPAGNDRNFALRTRGYLTVRTGGTVTIAIYANDAARLTIGGVLVLEADQGISARAARQVTFGGPGLYALEMLYYQNGSEAVLEVSQAEGAQAEGKLDKLDTGRFELWQGARLHSARVGASDTCQECGGGIVAACPNATACLDGLCQSCAVPDACGNACTRCPNDKRVCKAGACVQCATDFDCRGVQVCDPASSTCKNGTGCAKDADCPTGKLCDPERRVCVTTGTCKTDVDCPPGRSCDPIRLRCLPFGCKTDMECPAGQTCNVDRGICAPICSTDQDCGASQRCDGTLKRCVQGCQTDAECPSGLLCDPLVNRCVPRCSSDLECSPTQRCDVPRQRCAPFCRADVDCGAGKSCDLTRSLCLTGSTKERYVGGCSAAGGSGGGPLWPGLLLMFGLLGLLRAADLRRRRASGLSNLAAGALLVFFSAVPGSARADISANTLTFQPALGPENVITVEGSRTGTPRRFFAAGVLEFSLRPLRLLDAEGNTLANTVNSITSLHLMGGYGVNRWLALGVHLPVALYQQFDQRTPATDVASTANPYPFGIGDLRLWGKVRIIDNSDSGIGLALVPQIMFPTGQNLRSGGSFDFELLRAALDYRFKNGTIIAANFSFLFRTNKQEVRDVLVSHQVRYGLGAYVPVYKTLGVMAEIAGGTSMERTPLLNNESGPIYSALEGHLGARWLHRSGVSVMGGLGTGFTDAVGSPQLRVFAGVGYLPFGERRPRNEDPDPDHDGVLRRDDLCPQVPGPVENRGCPEKDTDRDGIVDRADRCPKVPGPPENEGCPDKDTDGDGIMDRFDRCPTEPGPQVNEGCPDKDTDKDGIVDRVDRCPYDPGPAPEGCPKRQFITVKEDKIELLQKVYFATNKATINKGSYPLLDEVVDLLKKRASVEMRIEGHTDNTGSLELNMRLSRERAASVREYLIKGGIAASRLVAEGFGPNKPVADNGTASGRDRNRRTEFVILKQ